MKEDFKEWRDQKKKAKKKMVDCPWATFSHKTWPGEVCMRCNKPVDNEGNPDYKKLFIKK